MLSGSESEFSADGEGSWKSSWRPRYDTQSRHVCLRVAEGLGTRIGVGPMVAVWNSIAAMAAVMLLFMVRRFALMVDGWEFDSGSAVFCFFALFLFSGVVMVAGSSIRACRLFDFCSFSFFRGNARFDRLSASVLLG